MHSNLTTILVFTALLTVSPAVGQESQIGRLSVEVDARGAPNAFLDSLMTVMDRWSYPGDSLMVSRRPGGRQMTVSSLREDILYEEGISPSASNRVYIRYRFSFLVREFSEEIMGLHYVYVDQVGAEIDLLYLPVRDKDWARKLLQKRSGLSSEEAVLKPFYHQLSFLHLLETADSEVQKIGGESATEEKKTRLINRVRKTSGLSP